MNGKQFLALLLCCAMTAFCGSVVGVHTLAPASAQTPPLGNGGPTLCDGATLSCSTGVVALNLGNANTWTATQTVPNLINTGLTASDPCVTTNGSKQIVDGTCALVGANNAFTGQNSFSQVAYFNGASGGCASVVATAFGWCAGGGNGTTNIYGGIMGSQGCSFASGASCASSTDSTRIGFYTSLSGTGALSACDQYVARGFAGTPMDFSCSLRANIDFTAAGHYIVGGAVCSGTGTFTGQASSGGSSCLVTLSAGTATWTFASAWSHAPLCTGTDQTAANAVKITTTTTAATITGTSADVIAVFCWGNGQL